MVDDIEVGAPVDEDSPVASDNSSAPEQEAAPVADTDWLDAVDDNTTDFIRTKGWGDLDAVIRSYQNLESMLGNDRAGRTVTLPKDEDDAEGYDALYDRLGRPESPDDYAFDVTSSVPVDDELLGWFRDAAHGVGLSARQAATLFDAWRAMAANRAEAAQHTQQQAQDNAVEALRDKWGDGFDGKMTAARQAAQRFGGDQIDALEQALGLAPVTEIMARVGAAMGEDSLPVGEGRNSFGLSPAEARAGYEQRKADPDFVAALQDAA
ncbi:MAG: hypothetical protein MJE12_16780, partial [Alphaproteobacteria bacterium]|nr:hypothetical protein [Alphaproteobacteria bacterium]